MMPSPWQASQRPPLTLNEKRPGLVAADFGFRHAGEQLADRGERAGVGRRVRARRAADRRLVDVDDLVEVFQPDDRVVRARPLLGAVQDLRHAPVEDVGDQRALARAGDAGDADELARAGICTSMFLRLFSRAPRISR